MPLVTTHKKGKHETPIRENMKPETNIFGYDVMCTVWSEVRVARWLCGISPSDGVSAASTLLWTR
jgi:hypothetical protein